MYSSNVVTKLVDSVNKKFDTWKPFYATVYALKIHFNII